MLNVNNDKVMEVIKKIHSEMLRKVKRGNMEKEDILLENRLFSVMCSDFDLEPREYATALNKRYGYDLNGNDIIGVFRDRKMSIPAERKQMFQWAQKAAEYYGKAMEGDRKAFDDLVKMRREFNPRSSQSHDVQYRISAIMIFEKYPEIDVFDDAKNLYCLGNTLARYFFYDIFDAVCEVYNFPLYQSEQKRQSTEKVEKNITYEQALKRISHLENVLERTNTMLQDLQDEFEEELKISKIKEMTDFFIRLNSEKYGCILDELLVIRKGVDELRKNNYKLPIEINGLFIMFKKLIQFVRDSHIEPIMKPNSVMKVTALDVQFYNYEGTPFTNEEEVKNVKVISPGWLYKDKEIQISRPKVKEEE